MKEFESNEEVIFGLIIDDLDETITPENKEVLQAWRKTDPANEKMYQDFLNVQINLDKLVNKLDIDAQRSWESLDEKIETGYIPQTSETLKVHKHNIYLHKNSKFLFKIAASLLIICAFGYYFLSQNKNIVFTTDQNAPLTTMLLPDGTALKLNAATTISYNRKNFMADRKLELIKGEIFIQVAPNSRSPFRVDLGEVEARDIGTSFNIGKNENKIAIVVAEGKVAMKQNTTGNQVLLTAGKLGFYDEQTKILFAKDNPDVNYKAWIDKNFVFLETPLTSVAGQLEKVYQAKIDIQGKELKARKLTATLKYQTVDSALAVISASLQCKVIKTKDVYVLLQN